MFYNSEEFQSKANDFNTKYQTNFNFGSFVSSIRAASMFLLDKDRQTKAANDIYKTTITGICKSVIQAAKEDKILPMKQQESNEETKKQPSRMIPVRQQPRRLNSAGMEVCVIKPTSIEEAREITETLLDNRTVILNLEGLDVEIAQRIIDFTSGSCYAIHGNLQKISQYIFIITPASVDISGDFQDIFGGAFDSPLNTDL